MKNSCLSICALLATAVLCVTNAPSLATELSPGETVAVSNLSAGNVVAAEASASWGYFTYDQGYTGIRRNIAFYNTIRSQVDRALNGNEEVVYSFGQPVFGLAPPLPTDPINHVNQFPKDTLVSIAGFGSGPVDVSLIPTAISPSPVVGSIQRSPSGDVVTFSGFSSASRTLPDFVSTDSFAFIVPGMAFGETTATASLTDLEGNQRILSTAVLGPIPEPTTLLLLPLAVVAMGLHSVYRRAVR